MDSKNVEMQNISEVKGICVKSLVLISITSRACWTMAFPDFPKFLIQEGSDELQEVLLAQGPPFENHSCKVR